MTEIVGGFIFGYGSGWLFARYPWTIYATLTLSGISLIAMDAPASAPGVGIFAATILGTLLGYMEGRRS